MTERAERSGVCSHKDNIINSFFFPVSCFLFKKKIKIKCSGAPIRDFFQHLFFYLTSLRRGKEKRISSFGFRTSLLTFPCFFASSMDVLANYSIFQELQLVHDTGYFSAMPSLEENWQQVRDYVFSPLFREIAGVKNCNEIACVCAGWWFSVRVFSVLNH